MDSLARDAFRLNCKLNGSPAATGRRMRGERIRRAGRGADRQENTPPPSGRRSARTGFLASCAPARTPIYALAAPPVCGPAFGSCSGGASGGDAWASASDTVNTSAEGTAMVNPASPRRESALRREITSDVLISNLPDFEVDEKADNQAYRGRVADQGPERAAVARVVKAADYALSNRRAAAATDLALKHDPVRIGAGLTHSPASPAGLTTQVGFIRLANPKCRNRVHPMSERSIRVAKAFCKEDGLPGQARQ